MQPLNSVINISLAKYKLLLLVLFILIILFLFSSALCSGEPKKSSSINVFENLISINDLSKNNIIFKSTKYDPNNYEVVYHDLEADINAQNGIYKTQKNYYNVLNERGKMVSIPYYGNENPTLPVYNQPGSFIYGNSNYTPSYQDSVYLSKSTGFSTTRNLTPEYNYIGGFCQQYKGSEIELEQKCNAIPRDQCASTSCCVLLGGSKCVSGNEKGPYRKANYTDTTIRNKDYYYYKGKCYGRCDNSIRDDDSSSDDEDEKKHAKYSKDVEWKTYSTPEENLMLESSDQIFDESKSSDLDTPYLYSSTIGTRGSPWNNPAANITPPNAHDPNILTKKYELLKTSQLASK